MARADLLGAEKRVIERERLTFNKVLEIKWWNMSSDDEQKKNSNNNNYNNCGCVFES